MMSQLAAVNVIESELGEEFSTGFKILISGDRNSVNNQPVWANRGRRNRLLLQSEAGM